MVYGNCPDIEWEDEKRFKVTADSRLVFKDDRRHHFSH